MIDIKADLSTPLKNCIENITGIRTIFLNPTKSGKRPQMPYNAFEITNITKRGTDKYTKLSDTGTATYQGTRQMNVSFNSYGLNAAGYLEELRKHFVKNINNCLGAIKLSYIREVNFFKVPTVLNNQHEERWNFTGLFLFGVEAEFTKDFVDSVEAHVVIKNYNNDIVDEFNLIVN